MSSSKITNYLLLEKHFSQISNLSNMLSIISWDYAVYMPKLSATTRQEELTTLSSIIHKKIASTKTDDLIKGAEDESHDLNEWQKGNLREISRQFTHANCVSDKLQEMYTKACSACEFVWRGARANDDYEILKPYLKDVVQLTREVSAAKSFALNVSKYDALIDIYEPSSNSATLDKTYSSLRDQLPDLIAKIIEKQKSEILLPITEKVDISTQKAIGKRIMEAMGFDFNQGRLDESTHPFCGGTSSDVRLTTRYDVNNFISGLMGIIHETGHGLYELNLPRDQLSQPVGRAKGMAFHESQSLIMEMQVGRSRHFIEFLSKLLKDEFGFTGKEYSSDNLYKSVNKVIPNFIRVDADEATYPLHVILRFEMEKLIISGDLDVDELPKYWNSKMQEYLGIIPNSYKNGCLQDIHWPSGTFGYFPSYTNGAIIASMLMNNIKKQHPSISEDLGRGDFSNLNSFLNKNFRNFGSLKEPSDLLKTSTGHDELQSDIFIDYLTEKYL